MRSASLLNIPISACGAAEVAARARGTPRVANRFLRRVWDFAVSYGHKQIDQGVTDWVLGGQGIDRLGLDRIDRQFLLIIRDQYQGGPVGIEALAATLNEDRATLEEVYEPYLVHMGFLSRGPRGRIITAKGINHLTSAGPIHDRSGFQTTSYPEGSQEVY
jgi:Holliday junction DNA helicase RuvB